MKLVGNYILENIRALSYDWGPETEEVRIAPIGDTHIGLPEFEEKRFKEFLKKCEEDNIYLLLLGDLLDLSIKDSVGNVYEALMSPQQAINYVAELLYPYRERIIGITSGNHELRVSKSVGLDVTETIAQLLGLQDRYSDSAIYLFLQLGKNEHCKRYSYRIYAIHGWGAPRTIGAKVNNAERVSQITDADCIIVAHSHTQNAYTRSLYVFDSRTKKLHKVNQLVVNAGSFLGYAKYTTRKGYSPSTIGTPILTFSGRKNHMKLDLEVGNG